MQNHRKFFTTSEIIFIMKVREKGRNFIKKSRNFMVKVSIKTFTGVRAKERKEMLAKLGYDLRKIKGVNELCAVKKNGKIV